MCYKDSEDYENKVKASGKWRKANDYETFNFALCLECAFFKIDPKLPIHGDCALMEKDGAYNGVVAIAVCNRFMSRQGIDINGKQSNPDLLSVVFDSGTIKNSA